MARIEHVGVSLQSESTDAGTIDPVGFQEGLRSMRTFPDYSTGVPISGGGLDRYGFGACTGRNVGGSGSLANSGGRLGKARRVLFDFICTLSELGV